MLMITVISSATSFVGFIPFPVPFDCALSHFAALNENLSELH
jgi:hypothetical protein